MCTLFDRMFLLCSSSGSLIVFFFFVDTHLPLWLVLFFFLMIRRPPRSTLDRSSAASDVYKRQILIPQSKPVGSAKFFYIRNGIPGFVDSTPACFRTVSYTHLRAHETVLDLVCRLLLEKKKTKPSHQLLHKHTKHDNTAPLLVILQWFHNP